MHKVHIEDDRKQQTNRQDAKLENHHQKLSYQQGYYYSSFLSEKILADISVAGAIIIHFL